METGPKYSFIIPAAGEGSRLGLPYPKELHRISKNHSLIDFSLSQIPNDRDEISHLSIVVTKDKESVVNYVRRKDSAPRAVKQVFFNQNYAEWPGSVLSAENEFSDINIVLLPDSILTPMPKHTLFADYKRLFEQGADIAFAYCKETDRNRLSSLGALAVNGSDVTGFCDKPDIDHAASYNGYWASFAFRRSVGPRLLNLMMRSVARMKVSLAELNCNVQAFPVASYQDLGTWPAIREFYATSSHSNV